MEIIQRGNPSVMKSIRENAEKISIDKGFKTVDNRQSVREGGAFNSLPNTTDDIKRMFGGQETSHQQTQTQYYQQTVGNRKANFEKLIEDSINSSIELLPSTKEYFNVTQNLFILYAMGDLNNNVLDKISVEDLREIKAIIREFKAEIDAY